MTHPLLPDVRNCRNWSFSVTFLVLKFCTTDIQNGWRCRSSNSKGATWFIVAKGGRLHVTRYLEDTQRVSCGVELHEGEEIAAVVFPASRLTQDLVLEARVCRYNIAWVEGTGKTLMEVITSSWFL